MTEQPVIIAVDIGTSGSRAVIFDTQATPHYQVRHAYAMLHPQPGWSEQNPNDVVNAVIRALQDAIASLSPQQSLAGIVLSTQLYSVLALDFNHQPLTHSLTWADMRSAEQARTIREYDTSHKINAATGCPIQALYPLSKILWLKKHHHFADDVKFVAIKDYVVWRLTGELLSDWSTASASGLLDIHNHDWYPASLVAAELSQKQLPTLASPRHIMRIWRPEIAEYIGLPPDIPLILGAGDAPLANIGVGAIQPNSMAMNVGTSAAARVLITSPETDASGRLWTIVADEGHWVIGGVVGSGGVVYDWLLNQLLSLDSDDIFATADSLASEVTPGSDGLIFIPYFSGEQSPGWNPTTRGIVSGMTLKHEAKHHIRAMLEGLTFSLLRIVEAISDVRQAKTEHIYVTGGLTASKTWLGIAADASGIPVAIPDSTESSARGAAILGWLSLGYARTYSDFASGASQVQDPNPALFESYQSYYQQFCDLNTQLQNIHK